MVPGFQLRLEFAHRINRRINLSTQAVFGVAQPRNDFLKTRVADNHQIDVAIGSFLLRGNGTINEGNFDTTFQRRKRFAQNVANPRRFQKQSPELRKHRTLAIRLIKYEIANGFSNDQPRVAELLHFSLDSPVSRPGLANQLAEIEGFVRMPVEKRQNRCAGPAE